MVLEQALETEISDHLGYESEDPSGIGTGTTGWHQALNAFASYTKEDYPSSNP